MTTTLSADVVIIGSGAGGGTLAYGLARSGLSVILAEQGQPVPQEPENWTLEGAFGKKYKTLKNIEECGVDPNQEYYNLGGQTKFFGAALYRLRKEDFEEVRHEDGVSPAWPIRYEDLEPYYCEAERIYHVHGAPEEDPTEPPHSAPYPFEAIPHERYFINLIERLRGQGIHVSSIPRAIDYHPGGPCIFCATCDAHACRVNAKFDAEVACIRPALETGNLRLLTGARCHRLVTDEGGRRVTAAEIEHRGQRVKLSADRFVVSCGVVGSSTLLLRSASNAHPQGLANSSGLVGRNLSGHNAQFLFPLQRSAIPALHQKTFAVNDYYSGDSQWPYPLGVFQASGQLPFWGELHGMYGSIAKWLAGHSLMCFVMGEVLPQPENRVIREPNGKVRLQYSSNNLGSFRRLTELGARLLRRVGYPLVLHQRRPLPGLPWHPIGTLRFGHDPTASVLDQWCRAHDLDNLYAVDSCFLPSAGAVNTSLTIMAQALRVADHITGNAPVTTLRQ